MIKRIVNGKGYSYPVSYIPVNDTVVKRMRRYCKKELLSQTDFASEAIESKIKGE